MLPDRYCQLLTAYVDGVLSARRRKTVDKLLRRSSRARQLLKELEDNANKLRILPPQKLDAGFPAEVHRQIVARGLKPGAFAQAPRLRPLRKPMPAWIGVAVAAAVLLMVTYGSYLFFSAATQKEPDNSVVQEQPKPPAPELRKTPEQAKPQPHPLVDVFLAGTHDGFIKPVESGLKLVDLARPETQKLLTKELRKDTAFHLDLAVRDNALAMGRLLSAFEANRIKLFIDERVQAGIKKATQKVDYLVFAENLRPDELTKVLEHVGKESQKDVQSVQLSAFTPDHRQGLARLLGVKRDELQAPAKEELKGSQPKPGKDKKDPALIPPFSMGEPMALVLALDVADDAASRSAQIEQFLSSRRTPRAGTLQVLVLVHSA
ncbi:MAG: hypothetical protein C5B56_14435 [Proteobacteria bacterium]|nr:MAG: hypothetical protein C5B56_14435 [Pseudomonadota bacterium]